MRESLSRHRLDQSLLDGDGRTRLRLLIDAALRAPESDTTALRQLVRDVAARARDSGYPVGATIAILVAEVRDVATPDTLYFNFDQILERTALWTHTVYRRG